MKKEILILFLLLILTATVAAQPVLNLNKQTIQPGETLSGEITTGEFAKEISLNDISFYEARKQVFFEYDLIFYNDRYFFYVYLDRQGNFTIKIKDILYKEDTIKSKTIEKTVQVKEKFIDENKTKTAILSIKPGFVFTSEPFELILLNKGNTELNLTYFFNAENKISLGAGETEKLSFQPSQSFSYINISTYENFKIPVIYIPLTSDEDTKKLNTLLKPSPSHVQIKVIAKQKSSQTIELFNFGDTNISSLDIKTNLSVVEFEPIEFIQAKSVENLTLNFFSEKQGFFIGSLSLNYLQDNESKQVIIPLEVYIFPESSSLQDLEKTGKTCGELGGKTCIPNVEQCEGEVKYTGEFCCLGECKKINEEKKNYAWIFGIIIFVILGVIGFFVYKKYKKAKLPKPKEKLKQVSEAYEKRVKGGLERG